MQNRASNFFFFNVNPRLLEWDLVNIMYNTSVCNHMIHMIYSRKSGGNEDGAVKVERSWWRIGEINTWSLALN